jgi:hypothetical protein
MGKHCPFENAVIRRFVSPLFLLPSRYHRKSLPINLGEVWAVGKQRENKISQFLNFKDDYEGIYPPLGPSMEVLYMIQSMVTICRNKRHTMRIATKPEMTYNANHTLFYDTFRIIRMLIFVL